MSAYHMMVFASAMVIFDAPPQPSLMENPQSLFETMLWANTLGGETPT